MKKTKALTAESDVTDMTRGVYRRIYSGYIENGKRINALSLEAEAWFWRVHAKVDDFGNIKASPKTIYLATVGERVDSVTLQQVAVWLKEMEEVGKKTSSKHGLLIRYQVDGEDYYHIDGWEEMQPAPRNGRRARRYPVYDGESKAQSGSMSAAVVALDQPDILGLVNPDESGCKPMKPGEPRGYNDNDNHNHQNNDNEKQNHPSGRVAASPLVVVGNESEEIVVSLVKGARFERADAAKMVEKYGEADCRGGLEYFRFVSQRKKIRNPRAYVINAIKNRLQISDYDSAKAIRAGPERRSDPEDASMQRIHEEQQRIDAAVAHVSDEQWEAFVKQRMDQLGRSMKNMLASGKKPKEIAGIRQTMYRCLAAGVRI